MRTLFLLFAALALVGCATQNKVLVATGTVIGVEIAQNPGTGLYQAKLGYNRAEIALVPTTNHFVPDVITEIQFAGMFSSNGGIYQRLAVGENAVKQPGAMAMFLKNVNGNVDTNLAAAIERAFASVPEVPSNVRETKFKLSSFYAQASDQSDWDTVAVKAGFESFSTFLILADVTAADCTKMENLLRAEGLIQ